MKIRQTIELDRWECRVLALFVPSALRVDPVAGRENVQVWEWWQENESEVAKGVMEGNKFKIYPSCAYMLREMMGDRTANMVLWKRIRGSMGESVEEVTNGILTKLEQAYHNKTPYAL